MKEITSTRHNLIIEAPPVLQQFKLTYLSYRPFLPLSISLSIDIHSIDKRTKLT